MRIIYFSWVGESTLYMLAVYAKGEQESLSAADKKALKKLTKTLQEQ